jgi:hypothetical protein
MTIEYEKPIAPFVVDTPSIRRRKEQAVAAANARAAYRLGVAEIAFHTPGTLAQKRAAVEGAIRARKIPLGPVPSVERMRQLAARYRDGARSSADYRDDLSPRGPRARCVPQAVVDTTERLAKQHGTGDLKHLAGLVNKEEGLTDGAALSPWRLRRVLEKIGRHRIVAARHGSRAAELDVMPRGTFPSSEFHEYWFLDEGDTNYYAGAVCRITNQLVSVRPSVIVVREHCAGAILAAVVVDPTRRIDKKRNRSFTSGFDAADVHAALLTAACAELAPPELQEFAGTLCRHLRWDNAQAHKSLEQSLFVDGRLKRAEGVSHPDDEPDAQGDGTARATAAGDVVGRAVLTNEDESLPPFEGPDGEGMRARRIPKRRPDRNGPVERIMSVVKRWLVGHHGHVDEVYPVDRVVPGEDLGRERAVVATANAGRQPRVEPVPVRTLPTIEELQRAVDAVRREYNTEHVLKRNGLTPVGAARQRPPRARRRSDDLVRLLGAHTYTVQREGIVVERGGRAVTFEAANQGVLLQPGSTAMVYVDPLLRMIWLEQGRYLVPLRPQAVRAAEQDPAEVAATAGTAARAASNEEAA